MLQQHGSVRANRWQNLVSGCTAVAGRAKTRTNVPVLIDTNVTNGSRHGDNT